MGFLAAHDMAHQVDLDTALRWHLKHNHYPSVPEAMVEPCKQAIQAAREESTTLIDLPEGVTWKDRTEAPAWAIIEGHHLEAFL